MDICNIIKKIEKSLKDSPALKLKNAYKRNPYTILMVTLLSLRSKDEKTAIVAKRLFNDIQTPKELLNLSQEELEKIIKPIGMQKQKAKTLLEVSKILVKNYNSTVPNNQKELLKIKGIGLKTANIVLNNAFNKKVIAVDTHVHRISNLLKIIDSKNELESSNKLNSIIPNECKEKFNYILVAFGQTICKPKNPKCDICPIFKECKGKS
jgi:endonuclease-3